MEVYRIEISGWTASFRYPAFIAGFQPTLPVPPLSTIYGLLSAAKGEMVTPDQASIGYVFLSQGKTVDLETIYELFGRLRAQTNVCRREVLFEPKLFLYLADRDLIECFKKPCYPLLLGRQTELAMVQNIDKVALVEKAKTRIGGTVLPFPMKGVHGPIQALPTHLSDTIPRKAFGVRPFYLVAELLEYEQAPIWCDEEKDWGVWFWGAE
jgi:CRISPR-associated protein Cas5t